MKKYLLVILLLSVQCFASTPPSDKARGSFLSLGVGPRVPLFNFAKSTTLGYGFNIEFSYTDNEYLPVFLFSKIGFEQYPGDNEFYLTSEYSHFSTTIIPINLGARYFFAPLMENIILLMPIIEIGGSIGICSELHQFKPEALRNNFSNETVKIGFSAGVGVSMFLMDLIGSYNYFNDNQFLSVDIKVRLPLFISF